jgi:hypothetical protein
MLAPMSALAVAVMTWALVTNAGSPVDGGLSPPPKYDDGCHPTDAQLEDCRARGLTWGPTPDIPCSGVARVPSAVPMTCSCYSEEGAKRRAQECGTVPSMPGGGAVRPVPPLVQPHRKADGVADAGHVAVDDGCHPSAAMIAACHAQGPNFTFGPMPEVYCSGIARADEERSRPVTCSCYDQVALRRRQQECSMVPSAAGGPARSPPLSPKPRGK